MPIATTGVRKTMGKPNIALQTEVEEPVEEATKVNAQVETKIEDKKRQGKPTSTRPVCRVHLRAKAKHKEKTRLGL